MSRVIVCDAPHKNNKGIRIKISRTSNSEVNLSGGQRRIGYELQQAVSSCACLALFSTHLVRPIILENHDCLYAGVRCYPNSRPKPVKRTLVWVETILAEGSNGCGSRDHNVSLDRPLKIVTF